MDEKFLEQVRSQTGSDGKEGWPVAVKDRVAYYPEKACGGNIAVTFLWTMRDAVIPKLGKENLAIATNFYTPAGIEGMVRNILGNPCIRYVIMLGEEYSSRSKDDMVSDRTSANAIRSFFKSGLDGERKLLGFPVLVHESTIPRAWMEMIYNIYRYGRENLMNANTDRWVKEINNMIVVVHDPQNMDLGFNPFLVPLTNEKIEAYKREILSSELPPGKAYTYGSPEQKRMSSRQDELNSQGGKLQDLKKKLGGYWYESQYSSYTVKDVNIHW